MKALTVRRLLQTLIPLALLAFAGGFAVSLFAAEAANDQAQKTEKVVDKKDEKTEDKGVVLTAGECSDQAFSELKAAREAVEQKARELNQHESELKAREAALSEEMKKIAAIRDEIEKIEASRKKEKDERVAKLVETLETMSPKPAAGLVAGLEETLAVAALSRMSTPKLAKIMSALDPKKSARLSERIAGVIRVSSFEERPNTAAAPAVVPPPAASGGAK